MPYKSPSEVAEKVRGSDKLSEKKRRQFLEVWNSCHEKGQPESQCFSTAWGVVKKADAGQIIGPGESEGSIGDAVLNKDIMDASEVDRSVAAGLLNLADDVGSLNPRLGMCIAQEARKLVK